MDYYHVWCNLKPGIDDLQFARSVADYLDHLQQLELIGGWKLTRRKLGLGPPELGDFHIVLEVRDLAQLELAFREVAARAGETERLHSEVFRAVCDARFGLYRDFPDAVRQPSS